MLTTEIFNQLGLYGPYLIFLIIFLESLNLTGIPAIVIMPTIGFFIKTSSYSFGFIFIITVMASLLGCITYYCISYKFGRPIYNFFYNKFPSTRKSLDKATTLSEKYGSYMCFIGRIIPTVRTFISLMSGVFKIPFRTFVLFSFGGIMIWNFITLLIGYFLSSLN